jgi:ribA/ribD-fused uncharacterized protein
MQRAGSGNTSVCDQCQRQPLNASNGLRICKQCALENVKRLSKAMKYFRPGQHIDFYNQHEDFYEFTNFYPVELTIEGKTYPTSEHYFQAAKFLHTAPQVAEMIRLAPRPRGAFDIAHQYHQQERPDWMQVREQFMGYVLMVKFQNPYLREVLLLTGNLPLREHTVNDKYWGDGGDGSGQNRLGQLLEQTRAQLQQLQPQRSQQPPQLQQVYPASQPQQQSRQTPLSPQQSSGQTRVQQPCDAARHEPWQQPDVSARKAGQPSGLLWPACGDDDDASRPLHPHSQPNTSSGIPAGRQDARDSSQPAAQGPPPRLSARPSDTTSGAEPEQTPAGMSFASQAAMRPTLQAQPRDAALPGPDGRDSASRPLPNGAEPPRPQGLPEELPSRIGSGDELLSACELTIATLKELKLTTGTASLGSECSRCMTALQHVIDNRMSEGTLLEALRALFEQINDEALKYIPDPAVLQYELASKRVTSAIDVTQCRFKSPLFTIGMVETQQMWNLHVDAIVHVVRPYKTIVDRTTAEILRVGGPSLRREMAQYATTRPGATFVTTGGGLTCRYVIHLVAPPVTHKTSQQDADRMVMGCLELCRTFDVTSVAIPYLPPHFYLPESSCAMGLVWAAKDFLTSKAAAGGRLAVYFIAGDSKAAQSYEFAGL